MTRAWLKPVTEHLLLGALFAEGHPELLEELPARVDIPYLPGFITTAGGEFLAVGTEGQTGDFTPRVGPDGQDFLDTQLAGRLSG